MNIRNPQIFSLVNLQKLRLTRILFNRPCSAGKNSFQKTLSPLFLLSGLNEGSRSRCQKLSPARWSQMLDFTDGKVFWSPRPHPRHSWSFWCCGTRKHRQVARWCSYDMLKSFPSNIILQNSFDQISHCKMAKLNYGQILHCKMLLCFAKYYTALANITLVFKYHIIFILPDQTDELHLGSCPENLLPTPHYSSKRLFNRSFRREPKKCDFLSIPRLGGILPLCQVNCPIPIRYSTSFFVLSPFMENVTRQWSGWWEKN